MEVGAINLLLGGKKFYSLENTSFIIMSHERQWNKEVIEMIILTALVKIIMVPSLSESVNSCRAVFPRGAPGTNIYQYLFGVTLQNTHQSSALVVRKHFSLILWLECQNSWFRMNPPISDQILIQYSSPTSYVFFITLSSLLSCLPAKALWSEICCRIPIVFLCLHLLG